MTESSAAPDSPGPPAWLDAQYNNRARVPEAVQHLQRWAADSAAARADLLACGQAVLVGRNGSTEARTMNLLVDRLRRTQAEIAGVVLTTH